MKKLSDYEKIMQVLNSKGISPNQAEMDIGVKTGVIGKLTARRNGFGRMHKDNTDKFIRIFKVNPAWWETGEGEMFVKFPEPEVKQPEKIDAHEVLIESIKSIRTLIEINDRLIVDKRKEVDRLHEDKIWAYAQIDKLTSRIGGTDEPKQ